MSDTDIFISYSREDREVVRRFAQALTEERFRVWWDGALHSGETFDEVIEERLRAAKAVVVLWSPRAVKSPSASRIALPPALTSLPTCAWLLAR